MENRYDIKINQPPPTDAEIAARKDFERILRKSGLDGKTPKPQRGGAFKNSKIMPVLFLVLAILALIMLVRQYKIGQGHQQSAPSPETEQREQQAPGRWGL